MGEQTIDCKNLKDYERLTIAIRNMGVSYTEFAKLIGVDYSGLSKKINGRQRLSVNIYKSIKAATDINTDWLRTGNGEMFVGRGTPKAVYKDNSTGEYVSSKPHFLSDTMAGGLSESASDYCEPFPVVRHLGDYDCTICVFGDSMLPTFRSGDVIALKADREPKFLRWGEPHVLDTQDGVILKRIYDGGDDQITCKSDNPDYPEFSVPKSSIRHIFRVVGLIRKV